MVVLVILVMSNFLINYLVNQKFFPSLHNKFYYKDVHTVIAPDISNNSNKSYLLIGDSYAQGAGTAYLNGDYNYSIAHRLSDIDKVNVVNTGLGGASSLGAALYAVEMKKIFDFSPFLAKFPDFNEIMVFFYEGNDLNNNIDEIKRYGGMSGIDERIYQAEHMSLSELIKKGYFYGINFIRVNIHRPLKIKWDIYRKGKRPPPKKVNKITVGEKEYNVKHLQAAAIELTNSQLNNALIVFEKSLKLIKRNFNKSKVSVVYLPSPATTYATAEDIITQTYQGGNSAISYKDNLNKSINIREKIQKIAKLNNVKFIDTTNNILEFSKTKILHGPKDWSHFNKDGYNAVYQTIMESL